jgi:riboflavin kinase/FMN adenylyltransferase
VTVRIYTRLDEVAAASGEGRVVAIGVFDGVHVGHQRIVARAVAAANESGRRPAVVTFYPHPEVVLRAGSAPRLLTTPTRKAELLGSMGIEEVIVVKFDREFARLTPESFCRAVLSARLGAKSVFVGENFHFGAQGAGTSVDLTAFGAAHGFGVHAVSLVKDEGTPVSSTRIRDLLSSGDVAGAARLLGRPHRLEGCVTRGVGRGRTLQAPTANLAVARGLALPRLGVYATRTLLEGATSYRSVTSVGTNPTFHKSGKVQIETLLLGFEGDIYGTDLAVDFLERIRGQRVFADAGALAEQIAKDAGLAMEVHERLGTPAGD